MPEILLDFEELRGGTIPANLETRPIHAIAYTNPCPLWMAIQLQSEMSDFPLLSHRYQLEEPLGTGGMAFVYRARDLMLERTVAIKVLREDYSRDSNFRERFRQEAKAAANLSHPNIVTVHDFGLDEGRLFIVMEFVPGTDLKSMLQSRNPLSIDESLDLIIQACAGVGYAHRAGLVHCDLKPQNMLITPDLRLKVVDFGIARALASIHPDEKAEVVWGSPQYFSPEQAAGLAPSPASDVYALGVVFYEMLTGQTPFAADTPTELARLHREQLPMAPRQINPALPPLLEQIVLKVLAKEAAARYRTADQFGRVLITFREQFGATVAAPFPAPVAPSETIATVQPSPVPVAPVDVKRPSLVDNPFDLDWVTIGLALLAMLAVGGLVPFWLWVYFVFNPPVR